MYMYVYLCICMYMYVYTRNVLLLDTSDAGKPFVCNALINNKVYKESLSGRLKVSSRARGCTVKITNYVCDNDRVTTDTIGFDDNRFDPFTINLTFYNQFDILQST